MDKLDKTLNKIEKFCNPISIFLYGSRARNDFTKNSDFEIGVIISKNKRISGDKIRRHFNKNNFKIYVFRYEDFIKKRIDTPFQKSLFLREIILSGKTIRGKRILENLTPPKIKVIDLIQDLRFNIGYSLAALNSYRNKDKKTAFLELYKSCLFGTRSLIILRLKKFPLNKEEIHKLFKKIKTGKFKPVINKILKMDKNKINCQEKDILENISYLNNFIEPEIMKSLKTKGNQVILK